MNNYKTIGSVVLATVLVVGMTTWAHAQVTVINQARALVGGVTPGDAPGFPVTISQPGSYRLASNLLVPAGTNGIEISASNVTLDLNGFTIAGGAGGSGVTRSGPDPKTEIAVINGVISFMREGGVNLFATGNCLVENLRVKGATDGFGISVDNNCLVINNEVTNSKGGIFTRLSGTVLRSNTVQTNGPDGGITCGDNCVISGNTSNFSEGKGISCAAHCVVNDNTANNNTGVGISVGEASRVSGNTVNNNKNNGISAVAGSLVADNTVLGNASAGIVARKASIVRGNTVADNKSIGINVDDAGLVSGNSLDSNGVGINVGGNGGATVLGNSVRSSAGLGLQASADTGFANNVFTNNNGGSANLQVSGGIPIGWNVCGNAICP